MEVFFAVIIILAIVVVFVNEYFQQKLKVSAMPSTAAVKDSMVEEIPNGTKGAIIELGSGCGGLSLRASKRFPDCKVIGYELSLFPFLFSWIRNRLFKTGNDIKFVRKNFFDVSFSDCSVVLCYLSNPLMKELKKKLDKELPKGAMVISSTFPIPDREAEKIVDVKGLWDTKIFIYKKKD